MSCSLYSKGQSGTKSLSSVVYAGLTQKKKQKSQMFGGSNQPQPLSLNDAAALSLVYCNTKPKLTTKKQKTN